MKKLLRIEKILKVLVLFTLILLPALFRGQTSTIGGVINIYTPVLGFDTAGCKTRLIVGNTTGFSVGDSVLMIQMKGANFDSTNSVAFGSIVDLSGAGNYDIAAIVSINSNTIMLNGKVTGKYNLGGRIQLVSVPNYVNANITASLTCQPWNGSTGGVLIFSVQNDLLFNANIDVSGRGFRGGTISMNPDGNCGVGSYSYFYDVNPGGTGWAEGGAQKGEGIGSISVIKEAGKGRLVNGGGGGNKHNAGGGGGSNYTSGGKGGNEFVVCNSSNGGVGGLALSSSYTNNVIFGGGGGGCGDDNNGPGGEGVNGGGIVIITTASITGNNYLINASGNTVTTIPFVGGDGAGGGGGGGSIFLNVISVSVPVTLIANGGGGGNQGASSCVGPGGGGGTGTILTSLPSLSGVPYSLVPGAAGAFTNAACGSINFGALAGGTNTTGPITSRSLKHTATAVTYTANYPSVAVCNGLPLVLSSTVSAENYNWNGPSFSSPTNATSTITIFPTTLANTGIFTLTASSSNGCLAITTISATINPLPTAIISNTSVCSGQTLEIVPIVTFASTYTWTGPGFFSSTQPSVSIANAQPSMAGNYNLTVTSVAGCTSSATGTIGVAVVNGITVSATPQVCIGGTIFLSTGGGSGGLSYQWTGPASYSSSLQNPTITPVTLSNSGNYTLVASVNGCSATPLSASASVQAVPPVSTSDASVCSGSSVSIVANSIAAATYSWSGPGPFSSPSASFTLVNANLGLTGAYIVTVTTALGCTNTAVANVSVVPTPTLSLKSDQPVCVGGTLNFTAGGANTYTLIGPNSFSTNSSNASISNVSAAATGNYTLTGDAFSCSSNTLHAVVIKLNPIPTITNLNPVCAPRPFQLSAGGGVTYTWTGPGNYTSTIQNPTITPSALSNAGFYTVVVEGLNGCRSATTTIITVITTPTVSATGATACIGQPATLNSSGAISYTWTGPAGFVSNASNPIVPIANNNSSGTYSLSVITINTCTVATTVELGLYPLPTPTVPANTRGCINSVVVLEALGGISYLWKGPGNFSSAVQNPSFVALNVTFNGIYSVNILSAQGCTAFATTNVKLDPLPTGKLTGLTDACAPLCSDLYYKPTGLSSIRNTTWTTVSKYSTGLIFNVCYRSPGDYPITGTIEDTLGCKSVNSFVVHVRPRPEADFDFLPLKPVENIDRVVFTNTSSGDKIEVANWFIGNNNGYKSTGHTAEHFFESAGIFPVVLTVKNTWGCWDTIIKPVEILSDLNVFVPTAFTPNGDGKNENFQPKGNGVITYQLRVFDQWGQKIFETKTFEEGWDGTFRGSPCKSDIYIWEVVATKSNGGTKVFKGQVLLCR